MLPNQIRFTFTCQRCGSALEGHSGLSKQTGRCPTCAAVFVIPDVDRRTGLPTGPAVVADDGQLPTPMHAYAAAGQKAPSIVTRASGEQAIVCPRCRGESDVDANMCPRCGLPFTIEGASAIAATADGGTDRFSTASFVCGVIGIFTFCMPVMGALAVVLGCVALFRMPNDITQDTKRRYAVMGMVFGVISLGLSAAYFLGAL